MLYKVYRKKIIIFRRRKIMFEALVIIFWFLVFYLAHKLYYEYKIKMMRKKWNSIKHEQEESNDLAFNSWYNR